MHMQISPLVTFSNERSLNQFDSSLYPPPPFSPFTSTKKVFRKKSVSRFKGALAMWKGSWPNWGGWRGFSMALLSCHPLCPVPENRKQVCQPHKEACILIADRKWFSFSLQELKTFNCYLTKHLSIVLSHSPMPPSCPKHLRKGLCKRQEKPIHVGPLPSNFPTGHLNLMTRPRRGERRGKDQVGFDLPREWEMRPKPQEFSIIFSTSTWICYWAMDVTHNNTWSSCWDVAGPRSK